MYWMSKYVDDYIIKQFLAFYYGYLETSFGIRKRTEDSVEFYVITQGLVELDVLERKQRFNNYLQQSQIFKNFCPKLNDLDFFIAKVITVYEIQNNMEEDYKEIFDFTLTIGTRV